MLTHLKEVSLSRAFASTRTHYPHDGEGDEDVEGTLCWMYLTISRRGNFCLDWENILQIFLQFALTFICIKQLEVSRPSTSSFAPFLRPCDPRPHPYDRDATYTIASFMGTNEQMDGRIKIWILGVGFRIKMSDVDHRMTWWGYNDDLIMTRWWYNDD